MELCKAAIGRRLRAMREAQGLSQAEVARMAGLGRTAYVQYETGVHLPQPEGAVALCMALGYTMDWIYRGETFGMPLGLLSKLARDEIPSEP